MSLTYLSKTFTNPFTPTQWDTFLCIADTFIPSLPAREISKIKTDTLPLLSSPDWSKIEPFLQSPATHHPDFAAYLAYLFAHNVPRERTAQVAKLLDALDGGLKTYLFCSTTVPFRALPREQREQILQGWQSAYLPVFRAAFNVFRTTTVAAYLRTSKVLFTAVKYESIDPLRLCAEDLAAKNHPRFTFEVFGSIKEAVLATDVVVIGSGAGGQVVAAKLAQQGMQVLVVEKGEFFPQEVLPMTEVEGSERLYEVGTALATTDGMGTVFTAKTWGGGPTVNWGVSLQLHRSVRKEWSEKFGLQFVETDAFLECQDRVCTRMGASTENVRHNVANQTLVDGARKLGYKSAVLPRNTAGADHFCGYCGFGCNSGDKRGGVITWLDDAQKAGAKFIQNCMVKKVVIENGVATGISAVVGNTELLVNAKKVIVSAGSVNTPCILENSGVKASASRSLGKNLRLHPIMSFRGTFYNTEFNPTEGGLMTAIVTDHDNLDGQGYGAKIYASLAHPGSSLFGIPWDSAASWKSLALHFPQSIGLLAIVRDRDSSGTVTWDPINCIPKVTYNFSEFDRNASMLLGLITCAEILVAAGADEIHCPGVGWPIYKVDKKTPQEGGGTADPRFKAYVAELRRIGVNGPYATAHALGSCRMGTDPRTSVVDTGGKVWGVGGLYVADASVLPTSTGVNPMVPTMSIADWIAERVLQDV